MFTVAQLWQCCEYLLSRCWRSNLSSFYVYPLTSCGSLSEIMTDINKTQTLSYLQKMSLLRRPSHFIMNQKNQQVEKENMYKISNIGFVFKSVTPGSEGDYFQTTHRHQRWQRGKGETLLLSISSVPQDHLRTDEGNRCRAKQGREITGNTTTQSNQQNPQIWNQSSSGDWRGSERAGSMTGG